MLTVGQKAVVITVIVALNIALVVGGLSVDAFQTPVPIAAVATIAIVSLVVSVAVLRR
jgi:hypothetical protein